MRVLTQYPAVLALRLLVDTVGNVFAYGGGVANYVIIYFCVDLNAYVPDQMAQFVSRVPFPFQFY
jgi:hypothetical protein